MDSRIQQALDGELARKDLSRDEAKELDRTEAMFRGVLGSIPVEPLPDLSAAILARAQPQAKQPWLLRPRTITLRPAYMLAAAAVVALVLLLPRGATQKHTPQVFVEFKLEAPSARNVSLAGDFTQWQPSYAMKQSNRGVWTIVVPLQPGVHDYSFIVDGQRWVADPAAPAIEDGFGGVNSRVAVLSPDRSM